jgi:hypothetical protein
VGLREDIRALYRENPNISGKQILERLGCKSTPQFWRILEDEQIGMRGVYPAKRKNRNKPISFAKGIRKGPSRWIPPRSSTS